METVPHDFIIAHAPTSIAIVDTKLNFISCSNHWLQDFTLKKKDISGKHLFNVIVDRPIAFEKAIQSSLNGTENKNKGGSFILPSGDIKWLKWKISPFNNDKGDFAGLMIFLEDITEEHREIALLHKAESVARIGGWEVDLLKNKVYWTRTTKQIHEVEEDYIPNLEEGINFYKKGFYREKITELVTKAIEEGIGWDTELIIVTAKGKEIWVRAIGGIEKLNNKPIKLFGTFHDIDTIKKVEIEYRKVSDRLKFATKSAEIGIWEYDIDTNDFYWNDSMHELLETDQKETLVDFDSWLAIVHNEDKERIKLEFQKAVKEKSGINTTFRILDQEGNIKNIRVIAKTIKHITTKLIGANWDNTEIIEAEDKLNALVEVTKGQNESLMNFAHIVSHNLRSHSVNLNMLTSFLAQEEDEDERRNIIGMITNASESLSETIAHLNDVVQVKTGSLENLKSVSVLNTLIQVQKSIRSILDEKNAEIVLNVSNLHFVHAVPAYLESIFLNVLTNAIKYSAEERTPVIKINSYQKGENIVITFADNGLGIDLKKHGKNIFGMYKTFHKHKDAKGIGLFITKNQIEAMNGSIKIESTVGQGTTLEITLNQG